MLHGRAHARDSTKAAKEVNMTASITILNSSNWDGEDYEIAYPDETGRDTLKVLKPGEKVVFCPPPATLPMAISRVPTDAASKPFRTEDGKQIVPEVLVSWTLRPRG